MTDLPLQPTARDLVAHMRDMQREFELDGVSTTKHLPGGSLILRIAGLESPVLTVEDVLGAVLVIPEYLPSER